MLQVDNQLQVCNAGIPHAVGHGCSLGMFWISDTGIADLVQMGQNQNCLISNHDFQGLVAPQPDKRVLKLLVDLVLILLTDPQVLTGQNRRFDGFDGSVLRRQIFDASDF